jgi:hypothetical protein
VPKRPCTHRAEWRLLPGKPAERLLAHYRLECDYGTPLIAIYKESDGNEPIYLCESHATEVGRPGKNGAGDRASEAQPTETHDRTKREGRTGRAEVAVAKPEASAPRHAMVSSGLAAKPGGATKDPLVRVRDRDLTYGNAAKAQVDEAIWNLATGDYKLYRTALENGRATIEAAEAAGGQIAIIHRKIAEYTAKIEALLSESNARIKVEVINKPLEQATLDIIGNDGISEMEKDAAIDQLGALQESLNRGLNQEITPLQAHRIAHVIGKRANWGTSADLPDELKPAYGAVYTNLRNAIATAVPDAISLFERLANLYVVKGELENAPQPKLSHHCDSVSITA